MTRLYDGMLRGTGLNVPQFTLLQVLGRQGSSPMIQGALGEILALDSTTLTRTLTPLKARKWIKDSPGADRRERLWSITPAGRRILASAEPRWARVQERLRTRLGHERWESLLSELTIVATAARLRTTDGVKTISVRPRRI